MLAKVYGALLGSEIADAMDPQGLLHSAASFSFADVPQGAPAEVLARTTTAGDPAAPHAEAPPPADAPPGEAPALPPAEGAELREALTFDAAVVLADKPLDGVGVAFGDTFRLHSNPNSTYKVYLDFDGHTTGGNTWNTFLGNAFYSSAFSLDASEAFNAAELQAVQQIWQRVAEYFSPFNIDVTTEDPGVAGVTRSGNSDKAFGIRVVVTDEVGRAGGGMSWMGSFDWSTGEAAFVYANNLKDNIKAIADAAAHEAGHSLGLDHDGQVTATGTNGYYAGHGSGATDWAPLMGVSYNANIVQWTRGEYFGASNTQDDLAIITSQNSGVAYVADDYGNSFKTAAALGGTTTGYVTDVSSWGVISGSGARNDVDMFRFDVARGGSVDLTVSSWTRVYVSGGSGPTYDQSPNTMLDIAARLYDSAGRLVAVSDDPTRVDASISVSSLQGGTYYLALDGVGWGDPTSATPTGYTEYGSLGQYMVKGSYTAVGAPAAVLRTSSTAVTVTEDGTAQTLRVFLADTSALTPDSVTVQLSAADRSEAGLSASTIVLTRDTGWSAEFTIGGVNDGDDDGDIRSTVDVSAGCFGTVAVGVTTLDNDGAVASVGARFGTYSKAPSAANAKLAALARDDGNAMTLTEGVSGGASHLEWRWRFDNVQAGDTVVHLDAVSSGEAMRFEYSNDSITWASLDGAAPEAARWNGGFAATATGSTLWVRVVDAQMAADAVCDSVSIDVLTVEHVASSWLIA